MLSCFSRVWLCTTLWTAAHQAPLSLGFSRQEHWSGLPFPSPMHEREVAQSCLTPSDPMDCSPPGSSVHGIFQARVLEWGAIAFSGLVPLWTSNYKCLLKHLFWVYTYQKNWYHMIIYDNSVFNCFPQWLHHFTLLPHMSFYEQVLGWSNLSYYE